MPCAEEEVCLGRSREFAVDPKGKAKAKTVCITHAHSDHARLSRKASCEYWMTRETHSLIKCRGNGAKKVKELKYGKKIALNGFGVSLHNAGHILGSSQVKVEGKKNIVFTSDFKLSDSLVQKAAEVIPSDILVIETTFGLPEFSFPSRETMYKEIGKWVEKGVAQKRFLLLGGYAVGKAQELTKAVNEFTGEIPLVHETVFNANKVYESHGVKPGNYVKLDHNLKDFNVLIIPPHYVDYNLMQAVSLSIGKKVEAAFATGWRYGSGLARVFHLSDHADFSQLLRYVKESNPKLVLTHHGFAEEFARAVKRKLGIEARPLGAKGQKTLNEFV